MGSIDDASRLPADRERTCIVSISGTDPSLAPTNLSSLFGAVELDNFHFDLFEVQTDEEALRSTDDVSNVDDGIAVPWEFGNGYDNGTVDLGQESCVCVVRCDLPVRNCLVS